jgi:hypothetical protein
MNIVAVVADLPSDALPYEKRIEGDLLKEDDFSLFSTIR